MAFTRRDLLKAGALAALPASDQAPAEAAAAGSAAAPGPSRMIIVGLDHPYWYTDPKHNNLGAAKAFWQDEYWRTMFGRVAEAGYDSVLYWSEPWLVHQWQTWLIAHEKQPEARMLSDEQQHAVIAQVRRIFGLARECGLKNILINMCIVTTPAFARKHRLDVDMPVSETVDWRHNFSASGGRDPDDKMVHWGVRNELTRDFTIKAIAELFETYPDLDGLLSTMGEALPGKRSSWYREALVPGFRQSGRRPLSIIFHWMMPLEDFLEDIAPPEVYDHTWLAIEHNGEILSDVEPYPISLRWPKQANLPTLVQYVAHNISELPCNSPKFAAELIRGSRCIENHAGFIYYTESDTLQSPRYDLFGKALAYYGKHDEPYSDEPWVAILQERFGDADAARHFVHAYNLSGGITPGVNQIAWCPHDGRCPNQLILKYWHWTDQDPRFSHFASPAQGATLLPVRYYAEVVARNGAQFRDNNGSNTRWDRSIYAAGARPSRPGLQELIWGHIDYQVTPEAHMAKIRDLGASCAREAEAGLATVRKNRDQAERTYHEMKAYDLLTAYYEHKVLTAVSALIYHFGSDPAEKKRAEELADETLALYEAAANYIYENLDHKSGNMKGGWSDESRNLPGLIEIEKKDRAELPTLFKWPQAAPKGPGGGGAKLGTTLPEK